MKVFLILAVIVVLVAAVVAAGVWSYLSLKRRSTNKSNVTIGFGADNGSGQLQLSIIDKKWIEVLITQNGFNRSIKVSAAATFPFTQRRAVYECLSSGKSDHVHGSAITLGQAEVNDLQAVETEDGVTFIIVSRNNHEKNVLVSLSREQISVVKHHLDLLT